MSWLERCPVHRKVVANPSTLRCQRTRTFRDCVLAVTPRRPGGCIFRRSHYCVHEFTLHWLNNLYITGTQTLRKEGISELRLSTTVSKSSYQRVSLAAATSNIFYKTKVFHFQHQLYLSLLFCSTIF